MRRILVLALAAGAAAQGIWAASISGAEPSPADTEAMQGPWTIESFTLNGNPIAAEQLKNWRRIVMNNHVTWKVGDQTIMELDIKFDPKQQPMTLDSQIASGDAKGQVLLAIYELKDEELRVCFAAHGQPRPTQFSSTPGSGWSLYTAKRVKP